LTVPDNASLRFGTSSFTVEMWIYLTASTTYQAIIGNHSGDGAWVLRIDNSSGLKVVIYTGSLLLTGSTTILTNAWTHIAMVREGTGSNQFKIYVNGSADITNTVANNYTQTNPYYIGVQQNALSTTQFNGYISNLRIIKGTAVYTSNFTPPTAPVTAITNTQLLLNFTNAGIIDSTAKNDLVTVDGAQISTTQSKFGGASLYFDGSGDYLVGRTTDLLSFNTGDFTVEMWVYPNSVAGNIVLIDTRSSGTDSGWAFYINSSSKLALFTSNADRITAGSALSASTWTHVVLARSGSTLAIYMNGVQSATATYSTTMTCPGRISIASGFDNAAPLNGYIDDLRITKGIARYTGNFTPPTAAFPLK